MDKAARDERRAALRKNKVITVYVSEAEKAKIEDAALDNDRRPSEFLRELGLNAAAKRTRRSSTK